MLKNRGKTLQVRKTDLNNMSIPKGMEPGIQKGEHSLLACRTRCKCTMNTTRNTIKVKFGIKVMKLVKSLIGMEVTVAGRGPERNLSLVRGSLHILLPQTRMSMRFIKIEKLVSNRLSPTTPLLTKRK